VTQNQKALTDLLSQNQQMMTTMQKQLVQSNERIAALTNELAEIKHNSGAGAGGERKQEQQPRDKVPPPPGFENVDPQGGGCQRERSGDPNKDGHKCPTCRRMVYHSDKNCPARPENKHCRRAGYNMPEHMKDKQ